MGGAAAQVVDKEMAPQTLLGLRSFRVRRRPLAKESGCCQRKNRQGEIAAQSRLDCSDVHRCNAPFEYTQQAWEANAGTWSLARPGFGMPSYIDIHSTGLCRQTRRRSDV